MCNFYDYGLSALITIACLLFALLVVALARAIYKDW